MEKKLYTEYLIFLKNTLGNDYFIKEYINNIDTENRLNFFKNMCLLEGSFTAFYSYEILYNYLYPDSYFSQSSEIKTPKSLKKDYKKFYNEDIPIEPVIQEIIHSSPPKSYKKSQAVVDDNGLWSTLFGRR